MTEEANTARDVERANVLINEGQFDPAELREALANGMCPFCGAGPFQIVLIHISLVHGISRREMREMAMITWEKFLLPDDFRKRKSIRGKLSKMDGNFGDRSYYKLDPNERPAMRLSAAGKAIHRETALKMRELMGREGRSASSKKANAVWIAQLVAMSDEKRNAFYRHVQQCRYKSQVESGITVGLDGLVDLVRRWRVAAASGVVKQSLCSKLAQEDGVGTQAIQRRLGKAVGLGLIEESELPAWKGWRFRRSIEFHTGERDQILGDNSF